MEGNKASFRSSLSRQKPEAAGCIISTVRKQKLMDIMLVLNSLSFYAVVPPTSKMSLPISMGRTLIIPTGIVRGPSSLDSVRLVINTNHHRLSSLCQTERPYWKPNSTSTCMDLLASESMRKNNCYIKPHVQCYFVVVEAIGS